MRLRNVPQRHCSHQAPPVPAKRSRRSTEVTVTIVNHSPHASEGEAHSMAESTDVSVDVDASRDAGRMPTRKSSLDRIIPVRSCQSSPQLNLPQLTAPLPHVHRAAGSGQRKRPTR